MILYDICVYNEYDIALRNIGSFKEVTLACVSDALLHDHGVVEMFYSKRTLFTFETIQLYQTRWSAYYSGENFEFQLIRSQRGLFILFQTTLNGLGSTEDGRNSVLFCSLVLFCVFFLRWWFLLQKHVCSECRTAGGCKDDGHSVLVFSTPDNSSDYRLF